MAGVALRRVGSAILTLLVVVIVVFLLQQLVPGDPAVAVAGKDASAELLAQIRHQLGLDQPFFLQLVDYVWHAFTFDLGTSIQDSRPVTEMLAEALPVSLSLAVVAMGFTLVIGVVLGTLAALRPGSWLDRTLVGGSAVALAVPPFVIGLLLQNVFAVKLGWLPVIGYTAFADNPVQWFTGLILPGLTLASLSSAEVARQLRGNLIDTREQDFIRTLRAKGLTWPNVLFKHAFRNAAAPMLTVLGIQLGQVIGGAVIIEQVFGLPGLGQTGVTAILAKDYPVVRGVVLVCAVLVIALNLLVDLINVKLNPRTDLR
ncbi:hypothetical protein WN71_025865 [Streptomyces mangrovisoli]|uniref:ABC transmembrane type-1 domain-containing protein n=2 Tax=Streptomyces mangrovisoli TaxID=1428628 RepID=A0A1J4NRU3_9ACTN|nr:hypothetical protein WN71_025865 [Streptomyces mangrovisoli]